MSQRFEEIGVYAGVAERTGVFVERSDVRHSDRCCTSMSALLRKARAAGDDTFYLRIGVWPDGLERIEVRKPWVVMSAPFAGEAAEK